MRLTLHIHAATLFKNGGLAPVSRRFRRMLEQNFEPEVVRTVVRMLIGAERRQQPVRSMTAPVRQRASNRVKVSYVPIIGPHPAATAYTEAELPQQVELTSAERMRLKGYGLKKRGPAEMRPQADKRGEAQSDASADAEDSAESQAELESMPPPLPSGKWHDKVRGPVPGQRNFFHARQYPPEPAKEAPSLTFRREALYDKLAVGIIVVDPLLQEICFDITSSIFLFADKADCKQMKELENRLAGIEAAACSEKLRLFSSRGVYNPLVQLASYIAALVSAPAVA